MSKSDDNSKSGKSSWDGDFPAFRLFDKDVERYSTFDLYHFLDQVKNILSKLLPEEKDRKAFWDHLYLADRIFYGMRGLPFVDQEELDEWESTHRSRSVSDAEVQEMRRERENKLWN